MVNFDALIAATLAAFEPLTCQPLELAANLARIQRPEVDGDLVMATQFFDVNARGELRIVHIFAPKIKVLTLFFFPDANWQLPVYCMELVVFGEQPIVALIDGVCLQPMDCGSLVEGILDTAHQKNPQFQQAEDTPEWFQACRSGRDFFIRPENMAVMGDLAAVHLQLMPQLATLIQDARQFPEQQTQQYQHVLQEYKHHHRIHAPGLKLMNRSFGEAWTANYMHTLFN